MPFHLSRERAYLLGFGAILLGFLALVFWLGSVLLPFGISVVAAYVLLPVAQFLERLMPWRRNRPDLARFVAVAAIFVAAHAAFIGVLLLLIPAIIDEGRQFARDFPEFLSGARVTVEGWVEQYVDVVPQDVREQIEMVLSEAGDIVGGAAFNVAQQTVGVITGSFAFILALATAPVLIFYLMKDSGMITRSLHYPFPSDLRPHLHNFLRMADRTLGGYLRGQLVLGVVVGTVAGLGLWALGISAAPMLGVVAGLTELVPIIGPWIGGAVGVVVTLATEPDKVVWVILLYLVIQLMENTLLVPRIQAETLSLHPVVVILVITLGSQFFGLWGVVLGPPMTALGRDLIVYFYRHWNSAPAFDPDLISAAPDHHPLHPPHPLAPDDERSTMSD
ncbi:MAG: AI-2E family transporter [Chloroflexota bacterium]|nr:AI-2E family transporter [Chloroflexota bacterium]MDE2969042.1 AI-2E family transporter [Chloroflexota bacterium]